LAGLVLSGNTLYGTTTGGGSSGNGMVFAVNTDGSVFTNLYSFSGGSDGGAPYAGLILSGNTLYGTTAGGGSLANGTVFALHIDGSVFTNLYNFTGGSGGGAPYAGLILSSNTLYGTTAGGGSSGKGTVSQSTRMVRVLPTRIVSPAAATEALRMPVDIIGQHPLWDDDGWRQFGQRHGVQSRFSRRLRSRRSLPTRHFMREARLHSPWWPGGRRP